MSSSGAFSRRLSDFKEKFGRLLGAKAQGYDELSTLERPLVGDDFQDSDDYQRRHGTAAPGSGYQPPQVGGGREQAAHLPSQVDEVREISVLAKDAAEILWEMVAMGESGGAVADMQSKAEQLQAQLRGLISDYQGGDESVLAQAFESFDMLSRCLDEVKNPGKAAAAAAAPAAAQHTPSLAPPPGAAGPAAAAPAATTSSPQEDLISF
ncbi:hypothetical protein N2152v2_009169 [Parachlorella kessleri]